MIYHRLYEVDEVVAVHKIMEEEDAVIRTAMVEDTAGIPEANDVQSQIAFRI